MKSENVSVSATRSTASITLENLTNKLDISLAEEVEKCLIDPKKITLDKFLGHGEFVTLMLPLLLFDNP